MFTHRTLTIAAAVVALATPLAAPAAQIAYTSSPVAINDCNVSSTTQTIAGSPYVTLEIPQRNLAYDFVNHGSVPATKVTLIVDDGSSSRRIEDRGTFSPGVRIDRRLFDATASYDGAAKCSIAEVQFADGSAWQAANLNVASAQH